MAQIDATFEKKLQNNPTAKVRLIVRTTQPPAQCASLLEAQGFKIIRTSTLINALTVEGSAKSALSLRAAAWVARIEEDKPVHTM